MFLSHQLTKLSLSPHKQLYQNQAAGNQKRFFWAWINIIFNKLDKERKNKFGPDRTCAEWILRNGGAVKFKGANEFLNDYNLLPPEGATIYVEEIDATGSGIMHHGFDHLIGCKDIIRFKLNKCGYLENKALTMLGPINGSLTTLYVTSCHNISDDGLLGLSNLSNLKTLILGDLPYIKNQDEILSKLKNALPQCQMSFI